MPEAFETESWNFYAHILNGAEKQQERWKRCTTRVDREMGEALGQVYVAKYFPPEAKQHALEMTLAIEQAMGKDIDSLDWMSPATKVQAKGKAQDRDEQDRLSRQMARLFQTCTSCAAIHWVTRSACAYSTSIATWPKSASPSTRANGACHRPPSTPTTTRSKITSTSPPATSSRRFFSDKEDDAANYGDMGSTIGHELTHGFDDEGRQYDKDGNLKDWWTKEDEAKFKEKAQCMVDQYDAIEAVPGVHLNGKLTLGENLADLGGLWLAWLAWEDKAEAAHLDMSSQDRRLHARTALLDRLRAAVVHTDTRPEQLRSQAQTDPHAPDEYRTNTVLQDLPEFAKSFSCKPSDKMVSAKPCRIW